TGALMVGEKGSGKSLLAKLVSANSQEKGLPTLIIPRPWCGDMFNRFLQSIEQPTVILFDEFEKVYPYNFAGSRDPDDDDGDTGTTAPQQPRQEKNRDSA